MSNILEKQKAVIPVRKMRDGTYVEEYSSLMGSPSHKTPMTVTDSPQSLTVTSGKAHLEIFVVGNNDIYFGGSGVSSNNGRPVYSGSGKIWNDVKDDFKVYLVCASGETSEIRIIEYD